MDTLSPYHNKVGERVLRAFLCYNREQKDGRFVERTNMSIARLDALMATVLHCLVEKGKRGISAEIVR